MENIIPRYKRPIASSDEPTINVDYWEKAIDAFDEKKIKQSVLSVLNYINPKLLEGENIDNSIKIIQNQGSSEVHINITETEFSIHAPFLKITSETNKIALLRKISEVNFSPLSLVQILLKGDELWFEYEMPLELAQPNKVYDIIRNVCVYSDNYDDTFINKYKASAYKEESYTKLTSEEEIIVWTQISNILEDYKNYTDFFKEKRWDDFQWDNIVISLLKLSNMPYIQGELGSELQEYISNLFNCNLDFNYRVDKGTNFMKSLVVKTKEEIMKDVYHAEQLISLRWRSSKEIITDRLEHNLEKVKQYEKDQSSFNLSYYLQFTMLKLIYDFNLETDYKTAIEAVLEDVSGLSPTDAAPKLTKVYYQLYEGKISNRKENKKKGFFSNLFS